MTLLAISNADGFVSGSVPGLAAAARVSVAECDTALQKLASPDPHSRTKDHEGRRIEAVDGGWLILNYRVYRDRVVMTRTRLRLANVCAGIGSGKSRPFPQTPIPERQKT